MNFKNFFLPLLDTDNCFGEYVTNFLKYIFKFLPQHRCFLFNLKTNSSTAISWDKGTHFPDGIEMINAEASYRLQSLLLNIIFFESTVNKLIH